MPSCHFSLTSLTSHPTPRHPTPPHSPPSPPPARTQALVNGDQKVFTFTGAGDFTVSVGFAVVETTDDEVIMARQDELLRALAAEKQSKGLSVLYLAVVNIVSLKGTLLCVDEPESSLAQAAFGGSGGRLLSDNVMDLGGLVSRKKDYIPAVTRAVKGGWSAAPKGTIKKSKSDVFTFSSD